MELRNGSPRVEVPSPVADRPSWSKVGALAAAGFIVGVAWPRLAGVRLGPSVPEAPSSVASASGEPAPLPAPSTEKAALIAAPPATATASAEAALAGAGAAPVSVTPSHGSVFACKTAGGESLHGAECGSLPGLDAVVVPRLRKLADCPAAAGASGSLRLVLHVAFEKGISADLSRNSGGMSAADALLACARSSLAGASVGNLPHDHDRARYSVSYSVAFASDGAASPPSAAPTPPARDVAAGPDSARPSGGSDSARPSGGSAESAEVEWDAAIVRDEPKTGKILARLPRGTTLRLGPIKDGWYPVKYGEGFASEGWVYRGAVGR